MEKKGVLMGRYELGRLLGQGTFAKVHYARKVETGVGVAIKIIDKQKVFKVGMTEQIKREISVMRVIKHPNVVELFEVMACKTKIYFVMEYVKGGELFNKLSKGKLREDAARKHFEQLITAVDYCHSRGVCHRDLKPENLLLDDNGNLKVSDFGLSALLESKHQDGMLHTTCGTPAYVAPDVINRKGYDGCKADIWSCGVILFVLLAGYLPFYDSNLIEMYRKIGKGEYKQPSWFPQEVSGLLSKILDPNPITRISIANIMENSWFQKGSGLELECKHKHDDVDVDVDVDVETASITKPCKYLNAFEIISFSSGLDLSGLLRQGKGKGKGKEREVRFTSNKSASAIMSKLGNCSGLQVKKREGGVLELEGREEGRKGTVGVNAQIFEVTPYLHLVEVKKTSGDSLEYDRVLQQDIRPALKDIIWTWQPDQQP